MPTYSIFTYPDCLQSCVYGWRELFYLASHKGNEVWEELPFCVEDTPKPDRKNLDLLLFPASLSGLPEVPEEQSLRQFRTLKAQGSLLASVCAGAFFLAATGCVGKRSLTTHPNLAEELKRRYPEIRVDAGDLVLDQGDYVSAGGVMAWMDLGLHLVKCFSGPLCAKSCARTLVWEPRRGRQLAYENLNEEPALPKDDPLAQAQTWIEKNFRSKITLLSWAEAAGMSQRTLERRWYDKTGLSPYRWLQRRRVKEACRLLETSNRTWEDLSTSLGYEDPSSFRQLFEEQTAWTPGRYRKAWRESLDSPQ